MEEKVEFEVDGKVFSSIEEIPKELFGGYIWKKIVTSEEVTNKFGETLFSETETLLLVEGETENTVREITSLTFKDEHYCSLINSPAERRELLALFERGREKVNPPCTAGCHDWSCCTPCTDPNCDFCKGFDRT